MKDLLKLYYEKYKKNFLPASLFIASIFILLRVVVPQFGLISGISQEKEKANQDLDAAQQTVNAINSLNESKLTEYLDLANTGLPPTKNISLIFTALSGAAADSNVTIKSYSIDVGSVYQKEGKKEEKKTSNKQKYPFLTANIQLVSSSSAALVEFSKRLYTVVPLAEVTRFRISRNEAIIDVNFFYKPLDIASLARKKTLDELTQAELTLLDEIRQGEINPGTRVKEKIQEEEPI